MTKIPKPVAIRIVEPDPQGLVTLGNKYLAGLMSQGHGQSSLDTSKGYLERFCLWCLERDITKPIEVSQQTFAQYKLWVDQLQNRYGKPIAEGTRRIHLYKVVQFFRWLANNHYLFSNPLADLRLPKPPNKLPAQVLTQEEAEHILNLPLPGTPLGLRDRAMLETLYSTGIRRTELANLSLGEIDFESEVLFVRQGKGSKDRLIPIGQRALGWVEKYLHQARPLLVKDKQQKALFVNCFGRPITSVSSIISYYVRLAGKKGSCHLFRHTMASLMLENGASIRYIQEMLGHKNVSTTEVYTKVSIHNLREVYIRTHPASLQSQETSDSQEILLRPQDLPTGKSWKDRPSKPAWQVEFTAREVLKQRIAQYLQSMLANNFKTGTIKGRRLHLLLFADWCTEREIYSPLEITRPTIELYQAHLLHARHYRTGEYLSVSYRQRLLVSLGLFFRWLVDANHLLHNPAQDMVLPKVPQKLPYHILSREEAEKIMQQPDTSMHIGVRDRAILETFYATGIRLAEMIRLCVDDIHFSRGTLLVREGKGGKDRHIPIGERALEWIAKYLDHVRPALLVNQSEATLFLTKNGEYFSKRQLCWLVKKYLTAVGIKANSHIFRHTTATSMLEQGADIRHVQEMLGHRDLQATEIYTKVSICKLKEVHTRTHPAKMHPTKSKEIIEKSPENLS